MSETLAANTADGAGSWSSAWSSAGGWLSVMSLALGPLAGVAAAWVAGRERRRDAHELLSTSSRPTQQRLLMTWMANVVAVPAGFVIVAVVVAAAVFPDARSYTGGRWAVTWLLVLLGLITCSAMGFAAGRLLPVRLAGPLIGVVLYCWGALATFFGDWYLHLAPVGQLESEEGSRMSGQFILPLLVWLLALTVLALIVATTRNGRLSVIVVLIATAAVIGLKDERKDALDRNPRTVVGACKTFADALLRRLLASGFGTVGTVAAYGPYSDSIISINSIICRVVTPISNNYSNRSKLGENCSRRRTPA
jgi:hypothetical protein